LEDAYTLVACLAKAREPREAFARYQTVRESKVHFVVNQSWRYGQMMHSRSRLIEKIMLKIVSLTPNRYYASQLNTINNLDYLSTI
jgi:2-polyprenyl-6-methoxyphenol hydroxylase-like FAD-dependent oxidoreductase